MAQQLISAGGAANDGTPDILRGHFNKADANFTELYSSVSTNALAIAANATGIAGKQNAITFGVGVETALGVDIGSAGAPVLFNGAGGAPSAIDLSNATNVPVNQATGTLPAANAPVIRGTKITMASGYSGADFTTQITLANFDTETAIGIDPGFTISSGVVTVPAGVSWIDVVAQLSLGLGTANDLMTFELLLNGASLPERVFQKIAAGNGGPSMNLHSGPIEVAEDDTLELQLKTTSDATLTIYNGASFWKIWAL